MFKLSTARTVSNNCKCTMQQALNLLHKINDYTCPDCKQKSLIDYSNDEGCFCLLCNWASQ